MTGTVTNITSDGQLQVKDGALRHVVAPGDELSNESQAVQDVAAKVWTPDVVGAYLAAVEAAKPVIVPPTYDTLRRQHYPPIGDQLDAIWKFIAKRENNGVVIEDDVTAILQDVEAVKLKFPKPV